MDGEDGMPSDESSLVSQRTRRCGESTAEGVVGRQHPRLLRSQGYGGHK